MCSVCIGPTLLKVFLNYYDSGMSVMGFKKKKFGWWVGGWVG